MLVQDTSGIAQGITQAGGALGQALQQRAAKRTAEKQRQALAPMFDKDSTLGKIISQPGGLQTLQSMGSVLGPLIKEEQRAKNISAINDKWTPIEDSASQDQPNNVQPQQEPQDETVLESVVGPQPQQEPEASPIKQIQETKQEIPIEKDVVQTKGGSYPTDEFFDTPFGRFHPKQLEELMNSPYQENRQKADMISKFLVGQEKLQGQEAIEQRKDWRKSINKFSEKYEDTAQSRLDINRLEKAKKLIENDKVNINDNWFRNVASAVIGDKGANELKELLKTNSQKELYNLIYPFIKPKDMGGSNPSVREVLMALQAQPSEFKGKEANLKIINGMLLTANSNLEKGLTANELRSQSGDLSYGRFLTEMDKSVTNKVEPFKKQYETEENKLKAVREYKNTLPKEGNVFMMGPDGKVREFPEEQREYLESQGGTFIK